MTSPAEAKQTYESTLLSRPGVTGVCSGPQTTGGKLTGRDALVVFVQRKRDVPTHEHLPREIDGAPVDVVEFDPQPLTMSLGSAPPPSVRPIKPGVGISSLGSRQVGTLGMMFLYGGQVMALTARHVLDSGCHYVVQPAMSTDDSDVVGGVDEVEAYFDAATVSLVADHRSPKLRQAIGNCDAFDLARRDEGGLTYSVYLHPFRTTSIDPAWKPNKRWAAISYARRGAKVAKVGAKTGVTHGYVFTDDLTVTMRYTYGTYTIRNTLAIYSANDKPFGTAGDSGATVVAVAGRVSTAYATLIAGHGRMTVAVPIEAQLEAMYGKGCVAR